jgi:hypothetical protein
MKTQTFSLSKLSSGLTLDQLYVVKHRILDRIGMDRLLARLLAVGITPNKLTALSLALGLVAAYFAFQHQIIFAVCMSNRLFLDGLDGYFARRFHLQTRLGARLDHWGDLGISALILLSGALFSPQQLLSSLALVVYLGEFMLLKFNNLLEKKFPASWFILFFALGAYRPGLVVQIIYQIGSFIYFRLFIAKKEK